MDDYEIDCKGLVNDPDYNLPLTLSHHDFVLGVTHHELQYSWIQPIGARDSLNFMKVLICVFFPMLLVPLFAADFGNWYLLFGIIFSYIGTILAASGYYLPLYLGLWFLWEVLTGHWRFKNCDDFFYICMLWGWAWGKIAFREKRTYSIDELIKKPRLYYYAVKNHRLIIFRESPTKDPA